MSSKKPELLAPAGSPSALEAAIDAGAGAVYFGASEFNARMRAGNFSDTEIADAIRLCRACGVKSYITMNTRLYDRELDAALRLAARLYDIGADAFIVADNGLAYEMQRQLPQAELHASTQLSGHTADDAAALKESGFTRMVCPREISLPELNLLCKSSPVEIEMFIHGAYCVSFSGQCLMSAVMGGRSGNRGSCAQPCRQPYTQNGEKGYPISLKDMCLAGQITDIIKSGVASLKIEGRQKPPEYVYGVTRIYKTLLREGRNANADELEALRRIFSRDGFTSGYFTKTPQGMTGVRTYDDYLSMDKSKYSGRSEKIPADIALRVNSGERSELSISTLHGSACVYGDAAEELCGRAAMTEEGARKCASKLGSTPFALNKFSLEMSDNAFITQSSINAMRREAVEKLLTADREPACEVSYKMPKGEAAADVIYTAEFSSVAQITKAAEEFFDKIYLPYGISRDYGTSLPPIMFDSVSDKVWQSVGKSVMVHTVGQLHRAKLEGCNVYASMRLNVFNSAAAQSLSAMGADIITVSTELNLAQMRDITSNSRKSVIVYGRLPLMTLYRCALSDGGASCKKGGGGLGGGKGAMCRGSICDRKGISFPIIAAPDCTNIIYNSAALYMADKKKDIKETGAAALHFIFTTESPSECDEIIRRYKNGEVPPQDAAVMRIARKL